MGVLIFAQHPALRSVALISILGIIVVVLVSVHPATDSLPLAHCRTCREGVASVHIYGAAPNGGAVSALLSRLHRFAHIDGSDVVYTYTI